MAQENLVKSAPLTIGRASMVEKRSMQRRNVLKGLAAVAVLPSFRPAMAAPFQRVRPGDPGWPTAQEWESLKAQVGGNLTKPSGTFIRRAPRTDRTGSGLRRGP